MERLTNAKFVAAGFVFIVISGFISSAILGWIATNGAPSGGPTAVPAVTALKRRIDTDRATRDSDADGLKSWEEALYGTDPENPDTDGDGTPDGQEIAARRDPLKKGPGDELPELVADTASGQVAPNQDNLTYRVAKNLFESGVLGAIDDAGRVRDAGFLESVSLPAELDPGVVLARAATVTANDIRLEPSNDPAAVKRYFNAVYAVYRRHLVPITKPDLAVFSEAVASEDYAMLRELNAIIAALQRSFDEIRATPVPAGYESFAVRELNYILQTKRAIEILARLPEDPLAAALMYPKRRELASEIREFHRTTRDELVSRSITFHAGDSAYPFLQ